VERKLELVIVPVSDVDRAKAFYIEQAGSDLLVDHRAGDDVRVVQSTPPGTACSLALMRNDEAPGSVPGPHRVAFDIDARRAQLVERETDPGEIYPFESGTQVSGPDPERGAHRSFFSFGDSNGYGWPVPEVKRSEPAQ